MTPSPLQEDEARTCRLHEPKLNAHARRNKITFSWRSSGLKVFLALCLLSLTSCTQKPVVSPPPPDFHAGRFDCIGGLAERALPLHCETVAGGNQFRLACAAAGEAPFLALALDRATADLWLAADGGKPARRYRINPHGKLTPASLQSLLNPPPAGLILGDEKYWLQTYPLPPATPGGPARFRLAITWPTNRWSCTRAPGETPLAALPPLGWGEMPVTGGLHELLRDEVEPLRK